MCPRNHYEKGYTFGWNTWSYKEVLKITRKYLDSVNLVFAMFYKINCDFEFPFGIVSFKIQSTN